VGQQLKAKTILLEEKKARHSDFLYWLEHLSLYALPFFYSQNHGNIQLGETYQDDCSYLHPYFQLREKRASEYYVDDEAVDMGIDDEAAMDTCLADRDVDWEEHDRLEEQFELEKEIQTDGFVIIALPDSVFVLAPWDSPDENEETMLRGFDFETTDVPREVIHCFYSKLS
jgi:hypothetical protein